MSSYRSVLSKWILSWLLLTSSQVWAADAGATGISAAQLASVTLRVGVASQLGPDTWLKASGLDQNLPYKIEWSYFVASPAGLEALRAGHIDIVMGGGQGVLNVAVRPDSIAAISAYRRTLFSGLIVPKSSPAKTAADLRGKKIAIYRSGGSHGTLLQILSKSGVALDEVTLVNLTPADAMAAFSKGDVDAWMIWDPSIAIAQAKYGARILAVPEPRRRRPIRVSLCEPQVAAGSRQARGAHRLYLTARPIDPVAHAEPWQMGGPAGQALAHRCTGCRALRQANRHSICTHRCRPGAGGTALRRPDARAAGHSSQGRRPSGIRHGIQFPTHPGTRSTTTLSGRDLKAQLRKVDANTADAFKHLRDAVIAAGPLDFTTAELIMLGSFATAGYEPAVKAHAKRLYSELGVARAAIDHAVLVTFGATATLVRVTEALCWIEEALAEATPGKQS